MYYLPGGMDESVYILTICRIMHAKCEYIQGSGNKWSYLSSDAQYLDHQATYRVFAISQ